MVFAENGMECEDSPQPVIHSYRGESEGDDSDSFLSIPDESYGPRTPIYPSVTRASKNKSDGKKGKQKQVQQEVYELEVHPKPVSPNITYHNNAFDESDVELDIDMEFTPTPTRVGGLRKTKSKTTSSSGSPPRNSRKKVSGHQNPGYQQDAEPTTSVTQL